ncbi:uncharacterized protein G2W53_025661 [Senna tora]|uniref:Uncharacterized protein n=1 Tax=Senna tora TaxID=362788 RepID=A0A834WI46_9FABA|nr:uncharacterized protein G2W53_025661 [Senna tora]
MISRYGRAGSSCTSAASLREIRSEESVDLVLIHLLKHLKLFQKLPLARDHAIRLLRRRRTRQHLRNSALLRRRRPAARVVLILIIVAAAASVSPDLRHLRRLRRDPLLWDSFCAVEDKGIKQKNTHNIPRVKFKVRFDINAPDL